MVNSLVEMMIIVVEHLNGLHQPTMERRPMPPLRLSGCRTISSLPLPFTLIPISGQEIILHLHISLPHLQPPHLLFPQEDLLLAHHNLWFNRIAARLALARHRPMPNFPLSAKWLANISRLQAP